MLADFDAIYEESAEAPRGHGGAAPDDEEDLAPPLPTQPDPIVVRGAGNMTVLVFPLLPPEGRIPSYGCDV